MKADADFLRDLQGSDAAVQAVAGWLSSRGHVVRVPEKRVRPTAAERFNYSDAGDLVIDKRVEVKGRGLDFTCANDFPFGTIFVSEKYRIERLGRNLELVVLVNRALSHAAVIHVPTARRAFTYERRFDAKQGRECVFVCCPKDAATFVPLERLAA